MAKIIEKISYAVDFEIVKFEVPASEIFDCKETFILEDETDYTVWRFLGSHGSFKADGSLNTYYICSLTDKKIPVDVLRSATDLIKIVTNIKI